MSWRLVVPAGRLRAGEHSPAAVRMLAGLVLTAARGLAGFGLAAERAMPQPPAASTALPSETATTVRRQARAALATAPAMSQTVLPR